MKIGGFQKFSLIDYPGKISAVIFTQGCDFRCQFCHNPELVLPERYNDNLPIDEIISFLKTRQNKLDGVVITGGEPTIQKDLPEFIKTIKDLGYLIKLDTNGNNPQMLIKLINKSLINYIAMDIKGPIAKYNEICGLNINIDNIRSSIDIIKTCGINYQFRTTIADPIIKLEDIKKITEHFKINKNYIKQEFQNNNKILNPTINFNTVKIPGNI